VTALSTEAIRSRLREPEASKRLTLSPILEDEQLKSGQASVDIRLGFEFYLVTASSTGAVDELSQAGVKPEALAKLYRREYVPFGSKLVIHPHQFMLAQSLEYMRLPPDLMSYVVGRSTWGRLGLIVATAVGIHPSFAGHLTLELRNLGETPLTLHPGQTIGQLFFHEVRDKNGDLSEALPAQAQYAAVDMLPRKISSATTRTVLENLATTFEKRRA
jgi:dCTP deaminase